MTKCPEHGDQNYQPTNAKAHNFEFSIMKSAKYFFTMLIFAVTLFGCDKPKEVLDTASALELPSKTSPDTKATNLHDEGLKLYKAGNYKGAIAIWEKELEVTSNRARVYNNIGIAYTKMRDFETAIKYHRKAIKEDPDFGHAHYSLGRAYYEIGTYIRREGSTENLKASIESFQKAIEHNYAKGDAYYYMGVAYQLLGEYAQAQSSFEKSLESRPRDREVLSRIWESHLSALQARGINTLNDYLELGELYRDMKKPDNALDAIEKARAIAQSEQKIELVRKAYIEIGELYYDMEKYESAIESMEKARTIAKSADEQEIVRKKYREIIGVPPCFFVSAKDIEYFRQYGHITSWYNAWQRCLDELELYPDSEELLLAIKDLKDMLIPLDTPVIANGFSPYLDLSIHNDLFRVKKFPKSGIVARDTYIYYDSLLRIGELSKEKKVVLSGVYPYAFSYTSEESSNYLYFYTLDGDPVRLVKTEDIIAIEADNGTAYVSPDKEATVVRTPITYDYFADSWYTKWIYKLWLKTKDGRFVFIDDYYTASDDPYEHLVSSYQYEHPISWSTDGKYLFVECSGKVFTKEGDLVFDNEKYFTSPLWLNGTLYMRGVNANDAVYVLDLQARKLNKFVEYAEGISIPPQEGYGNQECGVVAKPIEHENDQFTVRYYRINPDTTDAVTDYCMDVIITYDEKGNVINKNKVIVSCFGQP